MKATLKELAEDVVRRYPDAKDFVTETDIRYIANGYLEAIKIVEALAKSEPDEDGEFCYVCKSHLDGDEAEAGHDPDCAWVRAKKLCEEGKP
jgi:hypothetical protein